jgi:2-desacetyl-2-hydroxyethyl bacteriochlorophyllide A dehydrogenase
MRVEDVPDPTPAPDEVVVRVEVCGICGSDLHMYKLGLFQELGRVIDTGRILGHELSGEVVEIGREVKGIKVGDRVAALGPGGFAEYVPVKVVSRSIHPLPDGLSFEEAATLEPLATSLHAVLLVHLSIGETVVVQGAGIIGLGCVQVLKALALTRIIVVDRSSTRLAMAKRLGADEIVNFAEEDPVERVIELTGENPAPRLGFSTGSADVVLDCAGAPISPNQALKMLRPTGGRIVLVALFEQPASVDYNYAVRNEVAIRGSWTWTPDEFRQAIKLVQAGRIDRKPLVSHRFPLDQAPEAFETQLRVDSAIKVLVKP